MTTRHIWYGVFLCALVALVLLFAYMVHLFRKKERFTRERFAFVALTTMSASFLALISEIAGKATPWQIAWSAIERLRGIQPPPPDAPPMADHILVVLAWFGLTFIVVKLYSGWDGAISERQYDTQRFHRASSIVADGLLEAKRVLLRKPDMPLHSSEDRKATNIALLGSRQTLAWHLQARDLLCLRFASFAFSDSDWHPKAKCWIGRDRQTQRTVSVYCDLNMPQRSALEDFIGYAKRITRRDRSKPLGDEYYLLLKEATISDKPYGKRIQVSEVDIQVETETDLLNGLVDFSDYFSDIQRRVESNPLPDSAITLEKTYTPTYFSTENGPHNGDTESYLEGWLAESGERQLALLGEYGQGKSTTALMLTHRMIANPKKLKRVPILLELRGKSPKNMTAEDLLAGWAYPYRINPQAVMKLHERGNIFLILEGFDEIAQVGDPESRLAHFRTLWQFVGENSKVLFTGRPNFFLDDAEMKGALGISQSTATGVYFEALHLLPFTLEQIAMALRCSKPIVREGILRLARGDHKFREVVSRGSLLYVVSQLWERNNLEKYQGPLNSAAVLELFLDSSYKRQSQKEKAGPKFMVLNDSERRYFTLGVASYMGAEDLPNQIDRQEFRKAITRLYDVIPARASQSTGPEVEKNKTLKERLSHEEDPVAYVENDIRSSSILVVDQMKPGALRFAHKSFMEFLIAKSYADYLIPKGDEGSAAIVVATKLHARTILDSKESAAFFAEVMARDSAGSDKQ